MPTFMITGPDGKKYRIQGESAEGAMSALQQMNGASTSADPMPAQPESSQPAMSRTGAALLGAADSGSFSLGDELGAGLGAASEYLGGLITGEKGRSYSELKSAMGKQEADAKEAHPGFYMGGQIGGALAGGVGLAKGGLSLAANAAGKGAGLAKIAGASAADGALLGGLSGAGSGEGVEGRLKGALGGGAAGLAVGGVVPVAGSALRAAAAPIMSRIRPDSFAKDYLAQTVRRSGMTPDQIADDLQLAQADGQGMFTVADAMGHQGGRAASTVARTPNDQRQAFVDMIAQRQAGQTERLVNSVSEGFTAPLTADQTRTGLTKARGAAADINYGAARGSAGAVDPSGAIKLADAFLQPGATKFLRPQTNIADDSVESAVRRARSYLTDGKSMVTDFDAAFRAKLELDNMIDGAKPGIQRVLKPIRDTLDASLAKTSAPYANARDTFKQHSQVIDAVDKGVDAASSRFRAADTIPEFQGLNAEQQQAHRVGYADNWIKRVEAASTSPGTNKARILQTGKTQQEFPAFAAPGQADKLGRRIGREQRMFETHTAALGGSKTADNLADQVEASAFDPTVLTNLVQGRPVQAVVQMAMRVFNETKGLPPSVLERTAKVLMETRPDVVRNILSEAMKKSNNKSAIRTVANSMLTSLSGGATGGAIGR